MKRILMLAAIVALLPFLLGDMITLNNGKTYKGLIFSEDGEDVVKLMLPDGSPVYVNKDHVKDLLLDPMPNRADKVEVARMKDSLRIRDREYLLLKEAYDKLLDKYEKTVAELKILKINDSDEGPTKVPTINGPFIKLLQHEVKRGTDTVKISGILKNQGNADAETAELILHLYDQNGDLIKTFRFNALEEGKQIDAGAVMTFEVKQVIGRDMMRQLVKISIDAVNED